MLIPVYTTRFKKDFKRMRKRGCDVSKIKAAIVLLINEKRLEIKMKDHLLRGNFKDRRECHPEPDWLLIYRFDENKIIFERTGTHADLFR
jgi:mRNA interferase YafQ